MRRVPEHSVTLRKLTPFGMVDNELWFPHLYSADMFLGKAVGYISSVVNRNQFPVAQDSNGDLYAVYKVDNKKIMTEEKAKDFYRNYSFHGRKSVSLVSVPKKFTKKQKIQHQIDSLKRADLLKKIDEKYGSIANAEGSPELQKLRKLVGA